ncbi:cytochrome P450 monooxygenase CYP71AV1 [Artemisia annua]|uniref:Cytochrome P450 monooxygenase CYP71AV1 n=1 Tax=Artemisia annua TaxID=35608 RepID=A0A2U1MYN6_ARTAN|nr:cytochrome P450 monooxygenase CYP71AV1 [Artemisia annua]
MALSLTTSIALATILLFVIYKLATRSKSKKSSLPEPWRLPIIGHMHHLIGTIPHRGLMDLARKYGSLMHLQLGEVSTIVVSSPKWAKEILTTYDITFANRPETLTGEIVFYHNTDIVFAPYGEYWRQLRKLCTLELLSAKKVKSYQSLREEECWNLVQEIKASGSGIPVNLSENIYKLVAMILSRAAFGKRIKDHKEFTELVEQMLRELGGFDVADIFPSQKFLHHISGKRSRLTSIHKKLDNLINNLVAEHIVEASSKTKETLLDVLLRHKDSLEFPLTADNVKAIILSLDLDIDDVCGQGYDNGSNMKGRDFFGIIQRIYTIFANSSKRWQILKNNVKGLTVKPLSITRWESRVESVKAIRFQISDIREALLQVAESDNDSLIQSQAKSLATNDLGDFEFLVAIVIWFEILYAVNLVSKKLQSSDILIDIAIKEVKGLISFFEEFRETGLSKAINDAKEIAVEMDVDPVFVQKRVIRRKRQFDENPVDHDASLSGEESFKINYFLHIVDQAIGSLKTRFE